MTTELARRCALNASYSIRSYSRSLGLSSGAVSQILSGKRVPSLRTARTLISRLGLPIHEEENFVGSLAEVHRSRGLQRLNPLFRDAQEGVTPAELSFEEFRVISEWYHLAILELTRTSDFDPDPKAIAKRLGISAQDAKLALERLQKLGLLAEKAGRLAKTHESISTADKSQTGPALKRYQRQILEKALLSLDNDPIEKRNMVGMTMAVDPRKIPGAKKRIQSFVRELSKYLETGQRTRVYQLQNSLFPLDTESEAK